MTLVKIISGGQTGADQGALAAAKQLGIPTGGWMPRGFWTEQGPCPRMREAYGMQDHASRNYVDRTRQNVLDADGTVWVSADTTDSRGKVATCRAAEDLCKPMLINPDAFALRRFVEQRGVRVLNVAGPRASRDPNAYHRAMTLIMEAFQ